MSDIQESKQMYYCQCGTEGILVSHFMDDDTHEVYLSLWGQSPGMRDYSWRGRLRHIWDIIRKGYPYIDDVVLSEEDAMRLGGYLMDLKWNES